MNEIVSAVRLLELEVEKLRRQVNSISPAFGQISVISFPVPIPPSGGGTGISGSPLGVTMWLNGEAFGTTQGQVVRIKPATDRTFELTDTVSELTVLGVLDDNLAAGANGRVRHIGYQNIVDVEGTVAVGDWLRVSATAGRAESAGVTPLIGVFAVALTLNASGPGQVAAFVFPPLLIDPSSGALAFQTDDLSIDEPALLGLVVPAGTATLLSAGVYALDMSTETVLQDATGLSDGATTDYPTDDFFVAGSARVWQSGLMLRPTVDFSEAGTLDSVVFVVAPGAGDPVLIEYVAQP